MPSWDDLRLALAVARGGGLAPGAALLAVNPSTVFRRLNALDSELGVRLFDRQPGRWSPTPAGERLLDGAERMENEATSLDRELSGRDLRLHRLAAGHLVGDAGLPHPARRAGEFPHRPSGHPRRAADRQPDAEPVPPRGRRSAAADPPARGRPVRPAAAGDVAWTFYAAPAYLDRRGAPAGVDELGRHDVIGWDEAVTQVGAATWLNDHVPTERMVLRTGSLVTQLQAAKAGIGLALLPCYLADPEPELRRLMPPLVGLSRELWIVTHDDLKGTARVRAFLAVAGDAISARRELIAGNEPAAQGAGTAR